MRTSSRRCAPLRFPIVVPHLIHLSSQRLLVVAVSQTACGTLVSPAMYVPPVGLPLSPLNILGKESEEQGGAREEVVRVP